jgi:hypothetical protein
MKAESPEIVDPGEPHPTQTTPPTETISPVTVSHGGDTPNSMAVERATEPSLRSYSPTSSIRAPSEADYTDSVPALNLVSPATMSDSVGTLQYTRTPMSESLATLVTTESPQQMTNPKEDSVAESGEGSFIVVSSAQSEGETSLGKAEGSVPVAPVGNMLGRGKIDPKAQDDFIAFMMGKK